MGGPCRLSFRFRKTCVIASHSITVTSAGVYCVVISPDIMFMEQIARLKAPKRTDLFVLVRQWYSANLDVRGPIAGSSVDVLNVIQVTNKFCMYMFILLELGFYKK